MFNDISKVIFITDMDGTFLPSNKKPSTKNLETVKKFQQMGGRFSIATGRALQATNQYFESFTVDFPFILCNGGMIYDLQNKKSLYDVFLIDKAKTYTQEILDKFPSLGCEVITLSDINVPRYTEVEVEHTKICKVTPRLINSLDEVTEGWYKVLFCDLPENIDKVIEFVESRNYSGVDFVRSAPTYYEMLPTNISKGSAVEVMRKICDISDCTIVAAGDYNNDIEMLKASDFSFCPSNATDEVKAVCDVVLENSCDEDAIASALEFIIEQSNKQSEV